MNSDHTIFKPSLNNKVDLPKQKWPVTNSRTLELEQVVRTVELGADDHHQGTQVQPEAGAHDVPDLLNQQHVAAVVDGFRQQQPFEASQKGEKRRDELQEFYTKSH